MANHNKTRTVLLSALSQEKGKEIIIQTQRPLRSDIKGEVCAVRYTLELLTFSLDCHVLLNNQIFKRKYSWFLHHYMTTTCFLINVKANL